MKYGLALFFVLSFGGSLAQDKPCKLEVQGSVLDLDTKEPLPYATVQIAGTNQGTTTDEKGDFILSGICENEIDLEVRFLGYKSVIHHHDSHHPNPTIYLASDATLLEGVVIEESLQKELRSITISKKEIDNLSKVSTSIGTLTGEINGVSLLQTGSNISKPMVHGLHSNRVLVINNGVRHSYQVWGQEHAPEIDPSHVDQIEVVKGAATVKYGPDALGGVIIYDSETPKFDQALNGSIGSSFQSNGRNVTSQLSIGQGFHKFAWSANAFGTYQGDLRAPDYVLSNTGKRELGGSFNTVLHRSKFDLQIAGSYFTQELGILRGSIVGNLEDLQRSIKRSEPSPTFAPTFDIQNPRQKTKHGVLKADVALFLGDHILNFQYAFQNNKREEFDIRRGELNDRPVIDLLLTSHTFETEWIQPEKGNWNGSSGIQLFSQKSINTPGSNPVNFVPDYTVINVGAFTVQSLEFERSVIEAGLRFDYQMLQVSDVVRETFSYENEVAFENMTFTVGFQKELSEGVSLFSNIGSAWRAPNVAELYSFGYHNARLQFGLWRYELEPEIATPQDAVLDQQDRKVPVEQGLKWVSGINIEKGQTKAEFIIFANQINNYIFQRPYGVSTGIAGTFPFFFYDQTDALFLGSDLDVRYQHDERWSSEVQISYVYAIGTEDQQALLEIPPLKVSYQLEFNQDSWTYGLNLNYTARQWNAPQVIEPIAFSEGTPEIDRSELFDFMAPPDGFLIAGANVTYQKARWQAQLAANNVFNSNYRLYTDRLRYFANAPGRNLTVSFEYKF